VLEAVRQDSGALPWAEASLKSDPALQPARVKRNCLAGQGCCAPIARVSALVVRPDRSTECQVRFGLGGAACSLVCRAGQTLGDLASAIVRHHSVECGLVHVILPGRERCSPLEAGVPLVAFVSEAPRGCYGFFMRR